MSKLTEVAGKVGGLASIAQCVNVGPFVQAMKQANLAEQRRLEELHQLCTLLDKPREDVLEMFHSYPGGWVSFYNFVLRETVISSSASS